MQGRGGSQHSVPSLEALGVTQPSILTLSGPTPPTSSEPFPQNTVRNIHGCVCVGVGCRSSVCYHSTKAGSRSILAALVSKAKHINGRYERFLERTFPRFYVLYATFTKGESQV